MELIERRLLLSGSNSATQTASQIIFAKQPTDAIAGKKISPIIVYVEDSSGKLVKTDDSIMNLTLADSSTVKLIGASTVAVKKGRAVFHGLSIQTAGTYALEADDGTFASATSDTFKVNPSKAKTLAFSSVPATQGVNDTFSAQVQIVDSYGNLVPTGKPVAVTISLDTHPPSSVLSGTLTKTTVNGAVDFDDLSLNVLGSYTLSAREKKLNVISTPFAIATNSFILPYTADVLLTPIGGSAGATSEFGLGTSLANTDPLFTDLPGSYGNYGPTDVGTFSAGSSLDVYLKTTFNGSTYYAFSNDTTDPSSRTAFLDLNDSLGFGGSIYEKTNDTTYVMHLDDAASYQYDDNDSDVLIKITLVPIQNSGNS